jgi:nucleoside-diphosphate-sugar epimerase
MIILITGSTGFIGSRLSMKLSKLNDLILLDIDKPNHYKSMNFIKIDLSHDFSIEELPENVDAIIHLAQAKNYRDYPDSAIEVFQINTFSTIKLLEYARRKGVGLFIYASSGSVYSGHKKSFRETDLNTPPKDFYALSKYQSELLVKAYSRFMKTVILRFIAVYGPGQRGMLIPNLVDKVKKGEKIQVCGNEGFRLNPIYIDDAIEVICSSLNIKQSDVLNVGGPQALSILEMGQVIGEVLERKVGFDFIPEVEQQDFVGDIRRMRSLLKVFPKIQFKEGVTRMING